MKGWAEELSHLRIQLTQKKKIKNHSFGLRDPTDLVPWSLWGNLLFLSLPLPPLHHFLLISTDKSLPQCSYSFLPCAFQVSGQTSSSQGDHVWLPYTQHISLSSISLSCFIFLHSTYRYLIDIYLPFMSLLSRIYASWRQGPPTS